MPSEKTSVTAISWSSFSILVNVIGRLVSLVVAKTLIFPLVTFFCISNNLKNTFQLELILVFGKKMNIFNRKDIYFKYFPKVILSF